MKAVGARTVVAALGAKAVMLAALALLNRALELDDLPPTLPGRTHDWPSRHGRVRYTTLGSGPPLVLVHGLHAAASSFEMRKIFEPLAEDHTVYALDLLGFGKSERPPLHYAAPLYVELVGDFLEQVVAQPCSLLASSLSSAYVVATAVRRPDLVRRLVLICPTGGTTTDGLVAALVGWLLRLPIQGRAAFNALVSRPSLRYWLGRRAYADPAFATEAVIEQGWATAHQPNARFAPAALIGGQLNYPLRTDFPRLTRPTLVVWGADAGDTLAAEGRALCAVNPRAEVHVFERCGRLPHDERADDFIRLVRPFLRGEQLVR